MAIQVTELTKNREGKSLSILSRQFISFSYGGKNIEDFNLIAVFSGDRLSKNIYSSFEDTTTTQEELDGQFYWRTRFNSNELSFNLATDGMTQNELDEFKQWFKPGIEKELILSENHNRAIMARVSTTPVISMMPFEMEEEVLIGEQKFKTSTTVFKGDIVINFVMDEPYWYSLDSYFSGSDIDNLKAKIILEDGIPHISMFNNSLNNILLADNKIYRNNTIINNDNGISLDGVAQNDAYLYYCGTAPTKPLISFSMNIEKDNTTGKVNFIKNGYDNFYYLKIGNNKLSFTLPSIMLAYNKLLDLFTENTEIEIINFKKLIRDEIYDYYVRAYSIYYLTVNESNNSWRDNFITYMLNFFNSGVINFEINSKLGIVKINTNVKINNEKIVVVEENAGNIIKSPYLIISDRILPENGKINKSLIVLTNTIMNNFIIDYKYNFL